MASGGSRDALELVMVVVLVVLLGGGRARASILGSGEKMELALLQVLQVQE
jgi:hypothetical protein